MVLAAMRGSPGDPSRRRIETMRTSAGSSNGRPPPAKSFSHTHIDSTCAQHARSGMDFPYNRHRTRQTRETTHHDL